MKCSNSLPNVRILLDLLKITIYLYHMRKNLLITFLLVSTCFISTAQSITVFSFESSTNNYCAGALCTVKYSPSGTFKTGNKFKFQMRPSNSNTWQDIASDEVGTNTLSIKLPTPVGNANYYYYKIISTDPVVESSNSGFNINSVPSLQLIGTTNLIQAPVNSFEPIYLNHTLVSGMYPFTITFSDSSMIDVTSSYDMRIHPEKTGTYSLAKIANVCGVGKANGSVDVSVNNVSFKIINTPGSYLCSDASYNLTYSSSTVFDKNNKFKVRIKKDLQDKEYYDIDAISVQDGIISFKIPSSVPVGSYVGLQLMSSNPVLTSSIQEQFIEITPQPNAEVTSASTTINYGQKIPVQITYTGRGNFSVLMNDGKKFDNFSYYSSVNTFNTEIYPEKSTQFFVEAFSAYCGSGVGKNKMSVTVKQGVRIDSIPNMRYCTDSKVKVRIRANYTINPTDKYGIRMKSGSSNRTIDVNATLVDGNFLEFVVPDNVEDQLTVRTVALAALVNGIEGTYSNEVANAQYYANTLKIIEKPRAYITPYSQSYSKPTTSTITMALRGGGNFLMDFSDGNKYAFNEISEFGAYSYPGIEVYTQKTTNYSLKSIRNECGVGTITSNNVQTIIITNTQNNFVYLKSSNVYDKLTYCAGDKLKFDITSEGTFDNANEWKLEIVGQYSTQANNFLTTKEKSSEITLPEVTNAGIYKVRAYSTNPIVYSNYFYLFIKTKPSAAINSYNISNDREKLTGTISFLGGAPYEIRFSDNIKRTMGKEGSINGAEDNSNYFEKNQITPGIFELKSVSNACGVGIINNYSSKINIPNINAYTVNITQDNYNNGGVICYPLNLGFAVIFNSPKASDIPYSVQINNTNDTNYVNLATGQKGSRFSMKLPDTYQGGNYRIRIVTEDNFKMKSNTFSVQTGINISETTISLSNLSKLTESTIEGGNYAVIYLQNLNNNAVYVLKDNFNKFYTGNGNNYSNAIGLTPTKTTTYTVKSVSSTCGYVNASGTVKVNVKPTIFASLRSSSSGSNFCPNSDISLKLTTYGDFDKNNLFKTFIYKSGDTTTIREIASASVIENYAFKVPNDLARGNYTLRIKSSNPVASKDFSYINVLGLPDVTLSGGGIINPGSSTYLTLTPKEFFYEELEYELNDKTTGKTVSFYNTYGKYLASVSPKVTTTYTMNSIKNQCGIGKSSGSAKIEVNPASDKQVNFDTQNFYYSIFCTGSTISIPFTTKGTFTTNNTFTVQMSDAQGANFKDLKTEGTKSPLTAITPFNTPVGGSYLFRVVSSDKDATSTTNLSGISAAQGATARFDTASYYFSEGKPVKINVKLTGTAPYYFSLGTDEITAKTFSSSKPIYELVLNPTTPTKFKLFNVSDNYCGRGSIIEPSVVSLELITANEILDEMQIKLFPNPTSDIIYINSDGKKAELELVDITGMSILQQQIKTEQEELNISKMKTGTYFLRITKNKKQAVFKVIKL
jgi:hypothetical protein